MSSTSKIPHSSASSLAATASSTSSSAVPASNAAETEQTAIWKGDFGHEYTDRNTLGPEGLDELCRRNYGISRREINESFLRGIPKDASFLEVGCNSGNQLLRLQHMGYTNLSGVELQPYALEIARQRLPGVSLQLGSALSLPHEAASFEVVFTSGVLIHISPKDLPRAMEEIYRCSRRYIWGMEYYSSDVAEVAYRGHNRLLWKMDYARNYLERFPDLELVRQQRLPYVENKNIDAVFLLRKRT
jgi:pseudaminic acid biosynthesis-associated methylase